MDFDLQTPADTRPRRPDAREKRRRFARPLLILGIAGGVVTFGVLVALLAVVIAGAQTMLVTVIVSGDANAIRTHAATVADLLDDLGIALGEGDALTPPPDTPITPDMVVRIEKARSVTLTVDGAMRIFWTPLTNPADILASAGLSVHATDRVLIDGTRANTGDLAVWPVPATHISLRRAMPIRIDDGGKKRTVSTTGETVGEALFDAGVTLYLADTVAPTLSTPLIANMLVTIDRSTPVTIDTDGSTIQTRTQGKTVADALADAGVALVGLDYTVPSEDTPLQDGLLVKVIRVREDIQTETASLPFNTVYQADAAMEIDQQAVTQAGHSGSQETRVRVRYENGVETTSETDDVIVTDAPVNRIVSYGTNVVLRSIDTPDGPRQYWRVIHMYATSYDPKALGGDATTSTGHTLEKGVVAANIGILPYGTQVYVAGYGSATVEDTGGPRRTPLWIDLGYGDDDFKAWSRYVDVYVLAPAPPTINYRLPD